MTNDPSRNILTRESLERTYRDHLEGLAGAVRGVLGAQVDVREVLQDAFLRALRARPAEPPRDLVAWLFVIVLNTAKDARRRLLRRTRRLPLEERDLMELTSKQPPPSQSVTQQETLHRIREAIHDLADPLKEVFLLRVSGDRSFRSIALALDIPEGTAKTRMRSALAHLRTKLAHLAPRALDVEMER